MRTEQIDRMVECPNCGRQGRLKGALTASEPSGEWVSFTPDRVPMGFVLIMNNRAQLTCTCGTVVWPDPGIG